MREQRNDPKRLKGDKSDVSHKERIIKYPYDPLAGYKGYLLEKGNNIYIYGDHILIWKWHN